MCSRIVISLFSEYGISAEATLSTSVLADPIPRHTFTTSVMDRLGID
jgi:hypothetical protein